MTEKGYSSSAVPILVKSVFMTIWSNSSGLMTIVSFYEISTPSIKVDISYFWF